MSRSRPMIGLNMSLGGPQSAASRRLQVPLAYADALEAAGGTPVFVPPYGEAGLLAEVLRALDAFCFVGGADYWPEHYGGRAQPPGELMDKRRDEFDLLLAQRVLDRTTLPVLGICGGAQLMALARGGALIQDIRSDWRACAARRPLPHHPRDRGSRNVNRYRHDVRAEPGSLAARTSCR